MQRELRLVASNTLPCHDSCSRPRLDGRTLHGLADLLSARIRAGDEAAAGEMAAALRLSPFAIAIVAGWMARAGIDEQHILRAMAG